MDVLSVCSSNIFPRNCIYSKVVSTVFFNRVAFLKKWRSRPILGPLYMVSGFYLCPNEPLFPSTLVTQPQCPVPLTGELELS